MPKRMRYVLTLIAMSTILSASTAFALGNVPSRRIRANPPVPAFTLVVADTLENPTLLGAVRRTPGPNGENFIVIKHSALTPELLIACLHGLAASVRRQGEHPSHKISVYFMRPHAPGNLSAAQRAWADAVISRATAAARQDIPALRIGPQQAIRVTDARLDP